MLEDACSSQLRLRLVRSLTDVKLELCQQRLKGGVFFWRQGIWAIVVQGVSEVGGVRDRLCVLEKALEGAVIVVNVGDGEVEAWLQ